MAHLKNPFQNKMNNTSMLICVAVSICSLAYFIYSESNNYTGPKFIKKNYSTFLTDHKDTIGCIEVLNQECQEHDHSGSLVLKEITRFEKPDSTQIVTLMDFLYVNRTADYKSNSENLTSLFRLLIALVIIGLLILFFQPKEFTVPIINIDLPDKILYPFIAIALFYVWIQFGFTLNAALDSRLALEGMTHSLETMGDLEVGYEFSNSNTFVDQGILDAWCNEYYGLFGGSTSGPLHDIIAFIALFVIYGSFWGLIYATNLVLISSLRSDHKGGILSVVLYFISMLVFVTSCASFVWEYKHASGLMAWTWFVAALGIFLWELFGRAERVKIADKIISESTYESRQ
jgi:hypothetical protein